MKKVSIKIMHNDILTIIAPVDTITFNPDGLDVSTGMQIFEIKAQNYDISINQTNVDASADAPYFQEINLGKRE